MASHLYGGDRGTMHDSRLLRQSNFLDQIREKQNGFTSGGYALYGDAGYFNHEMLRKPFSQAKKNADGRRKKNNKIMSKVRITVEWCVRSLNLWTFISR